MPMYVTAADVLVGPVLGATVVFANLSCSRVCE